MSRILKPNGIILASTLPRVLDDYNSAEDSRGYLKMRDYGQLGYYRGKNIFDIHGSVVAPAELVDTLNRINNTRFKLEYGIANSSNNGTINYGGQISGQKLNNEGLDLSNLFYCLSGANDIGYILAKDHIEKALLQQHGFISISERLK